MKILHVISRLGIGGAERSLSYLAPALAGLGHEVHVAYIRDGIFRNRLDNTPVIQHLLKSRNNYDPVLIVHLYSLCRKIQPDLIITWQLQMDILGGIAGRLSGTPHVIHERSSALEYPKGWKNTLRTLTAKRTAAVISNSSGGDRYWKKLYPNKLRYIIPNGLPLEEIEQTPPAAIEQYGFDSNQRFILFAGRLEACKNLETLIRAHSTVALQVPINLVLCGDGALRPALKAQVHAAGIQKYVFFTGFVSNNQIWSLMKKAAAFALISHYEGLPNVVIEAMTCGCPLVVSDIPAHREFLDNTTAVFTDPKHPQSVADAILEILDNPNSTQIRVENARRKSTEFSLQTMAQRYMRIYTEILSQRENHL